MRNLIRAFAGFGVQSAQWLLCFFVCALGLSLGGRPLWPAVPLGLLAGAALSALFPRADGAAGGAPESAPENPDVAAALRPAGSSSPPLCFILARPADADPLFPAGAAARDVPLPFAWRRRDDADWREFLARLPAVIAGFSGKNFAGGIVVRLAADWLAAEDETAILKKARLLGARIADLRRAADAPLPVFLLVDGVDRLYGWRTAASLLPEELRAEPLGRFRRARGGSVDALVDALTADAARLAFAAGAAGADASASPAHLQAPAEFNRAANRLRFFAKRLAGGNGDADSAPQGIFFLSSIPGLPALPPLAAAPSFVPAEEEPCAAGSLFQDELLARVLPRAFRRGADEADARARRRRSVAFHTAAAALAAASVLIGGLLTSSFARTRGILLSAAGAAAHPETRGRLGDYLRLAEETAGRSGGSALPRLGMDEDESLAAELKRRFADGYFDLKTVPGMEHLQNAALDAVRSGDPRALGNALLMLVLVRDGLDGATGRPTLSDGTRDALTDAALALGLTDAEEMRQLRAFLDWAGERDWMPAAREALLRFERHIAASDPRGSWLPRWAEAAVVSTGIGDEPPPLPENLSPAWSRRAHAIADALAAGVNDNGAPAWRAGAMDDYRRRALAAWADAADRLWDGMPENIPDAEIPGRLRLAASGRDPAALFAERAREELLPMFGGGSGSGGGAAAAIAAWPALSSAAVDRYVRHLRAREDALRLDGVWLRTVYTPARLTPGGGEARRERLARAGGLLETFLTGPADGRWTWQNGRVENARTDGVPFSFSREFLDFCNATLELGRLPAVEKLPLALAVDSAGVSGRRVLERPVAVHFRLGSAKDGQTIRYRNYPVSGKWEWTPGVEEAELRVEFPSGAAVTAFSGREEVRRFLTLFGEGACVLEPESFGAEGLFLRRLGVEEIRIGASLDGLAEVLPRLSLPAPPALPRSILEAR